MVGYDDQNHAFPVHVDAQGREMTNQTNSYVYNMMAAFAVGMWRVGHHSGDQELTEIAEDMITERILPRQGPDGYWNYGEPRVGYEPVPPVMPREERLENYHGLTLLKLTYLLSYDFWAEQEDFRQALLQGCDYAGTFVDRHGRATPWPTLEAVRQGQVETHKWTMETQASITVSRARAGLHLDRPELIAGASRMMNWWFHNRPVLLPFMHGGNPFYGYQDLLVSGGYEHCARLALVLAWEGWHLRRVDAWTVELANLPLGTQVQ